MIKKQFCCLLMSLAASLPGISPVFSQNSDFARQGPSGIFVGLGKNVPNGINTAYYKIEQSENEGMWKAIGESRAPATYEEFLTRVESNKTIFTGTVIPSRDQLEKLWQKAVKTGLFEPGDSWVLSFPVRMAFGILYYDRDVKEKNKYKYRVTAFDQSDRQLEQNISEVATWPLIPIFDTIALIGFERSAKLLSLKWKSVGKHPAADFRVFRFENEKPLMMTGKTVAYAKKDTTYYLYQDTSPVIVEMKDLMCFLMPMDAYENMGKSSTVIQAGTAGFNQVYFTQTRALKEPEKLGITLSWKISDNVPVRVIEVYRSLDFGKGFKMITTLSPSDSSFTDPNVTPDKIYYYYLQAWGTFDFQKSQSNTFFDYGMDPGPPVTPSIYKATGVNNGVELMVLLNDINISGIRVFRSDGLSDSLYALGDIVRSDSNSVVFHDTSSALNGYHYYHYAVKSENTSHRLSDLSNTVSVRPLKPTFPETPTSFRAYLDDKKVKLFWDNGGSERSNILGYKISRRQETGRDNDTKSYLYLPEGESVLYSNYYTDSTAEAGKTYSYNLQAVDIYNGVSKNSANLTISIPGEIPIPPTDLKAVNTPDGIVLEWGPAILENIDMYRIYRYQRGNEPEIIKLVSKNVITYTDNSAQKDQLYFYYLTTVDKNNQESVPCREVGILR